MGLDQYAGTMREESYEYKKPNGETFTETWQQAGPFQWRKHARLQEFMNQLHMERNKIKDKWEKDIDSNGQVWINPVSWNKIELSKEDIDKLEKAINNHYSGSFCDGGFFWGHEIQESQAEYYKDKDLEFVEFAKEALEDGETVIYECSW